MRRGKSAEEIAASILRREGFEVVARNYRVELEGELVAEIDVVAEKDGERYAVEVKAGTVGVDAVRQAYVAAELTGYRPLVMGRRVHPSARALADRLGVDVKEFSEFVEVEPIDELSAVVSDHLQDRMIRILSAASNVSWKDLYEALQGDLRRVTERVRTRDRVQAEELIEALALLKLMAAKTVGAVKDVEGEEFLLELDPRVEVPKDTALVVLNRWGSPTFVTAEPMSVGTYRVRMRLWEGDVRPGDRVVYLGELRG